MKLLSTVLLAVSLFALAGCHFEHALPFSDRGVVVTSCPTNLELIVNDQVCVTPCTIKASTSDDGAVISYNGKTSLVPYKKSLVSGYEITGTIIVADPSKIGLPTDRPDGIYFLQDLVGVADICGTSLGTTWTPSTSDIISIPEPETPVVIEEEQPVETVEVEQETPAADAPLEDDILETTDGELETEAYELDILEEPETLEE
ncbi:MAG: hypothetical protein LBP51_02870 [Deferribacteraceae bacterium]|nr:hypothetical protein [Deferribacteraceae bacterium]